MHWCAWCIDLWRTRVVPIRTAEERIKVSSENRIFGS